MQQIKIIDVLVRGAGMALSTWKGLEYNANKMTLGGGHLFITLSLDMRTRSKMVQTKYTTSGKISSLN
jgi:hypothetical protein